MASDFYVLEDWANLQNKPENNGIYNCRNKYLSESDALKRKATNARSQVAFIWLWTRLDATEAPDLYQ